MFIKGLKTYPAHKNFLEFLQQILTECNMCQVTRLHLTRLIAAAVGAALVTSAAIAQQRQSPAEQQSDAAVVDVDRSDHTADPGTVQRVDGLAIYFATVPAAFVLGHPAEHTGRGSHGDAPDGPYVHHLLVAVFDSITGLRITDARVTAIVQSGLHPSQGPIALEPMMLGGARAYGGFAALPPRDRYRIEVEVARPGAAVARAVFFHQHLQPQP